MNILIHGIGGKMGRVLYAAANQTEHTNVVFGVDKYADPKNFACPVFQTLQETPDVVIDCIIDFSVREALYDLLPFAIEKKLPLVLATTGYSQEEQALIQKASEHIAIFQTGNMSLGVNVLSKLVALATQMLGERADIEIVETHHNQKVDAPSGTAKLLFDACQQQNPDLSPLARPQGIVGARGKNEVGIHAVRGGSVVGKHAVQFFLDNEVITLTHEAESKTIFANGSLKAAEFLITQKPGIYDMNDALALHK